LEIKRNITTLHLHERPEFATTLVHWFMDEWEPYYGRSGPGDARKDLEECAGRDQLPLCLIALDERDRMLGTIALKETSVGSELNVGPWVAALLVDHQYQGRGVGPVLIEAITTEAARLGFEKIYTSGGPDDAIFESQGWRPYGETTSLRGPLIVYERVLEKSAPQN